MQRNCSHITNVRNPVLSERGSVQQHLCYKTWITVLSAGLVLCSVESEGEVTVNRSGWNNWLYTSSLVTQVSDIQETQMQGHTSNLGSWNLKISQMHLSDCWVGVILICTVQYVKVPLSVHTDDQHISVSKWSLCMQWCRLIQKKCKCI